MRQNESSEGCCSLSTGAKQKCGKLSGSVADGGNLKTLSTESGSCDGIATIDAAGCWLLGAAGWLNWTIGPYSIVMVMDCAPVNTSSAGGGGSDVRAAIEQRRGRRVCP